MKTFKRNQIEEAIAQLVGRSNRAPGKELRTRIKRLLDVDRALGRDVRSSDPEEANYAFFSDEAPGKGSEVEFSEYEAFAILLGLRFLEHDWSQGFAVQLLRRFRPKIEGRHGSIAEEPPLPLDTRRRPSAGELVQDIGNPVLLSILSQGTTTTKDPVQPILEIDEDKSAPMRRLMQKPGQSMTTMEIRTQAHALLAALATTEPKKRGRP